MRLFRRIFALLSLFAFSFPVFAASQSPAQSVPPIPAQSSSQSSTQPLAQPSPQAAPKLVAESHRDDPLAAAARELARKVAASVGAAIQGKLTMAPNCANLSSLSLFEFQKACGVFHDEIEQQTNAFH